MIGVIAEAADHDIVREFFELFKTPWEFFREHRTYDVLLCVGDQRFDSSAKLVIVYAGGRIKQDGEQPVRILPKSDIGCFVISDTHRIPIYGDSVIFSHKTTSLLKNENSQECVAYLDKEADTCWARIGYSLFGEIRTLLTVGQPQCNAEIPTLELHISFLRNLITECGIPFIEIPPVPEGFQFIACLTHDVDHPSLRQQELDHTLIGFLLRATLGSCVDVVFGRMSLSCAMKNWLAAIRLPFVYLGLAKDFWRDFDDRYLEIEKDLPSTFFLIPRKNYPGKHHSGSAPALRSVRYEAADLTDSISKLRAHGREVGLHGIDAWVDSSAGQEEIASICRLAGVAEVGVRMHWLYYDEDSPKKLERAGAAYDSTTGYNATVGYRAGTTQVFKPLAVQRLLELPLHAMDTALFYLSYLGLSPQEASLCLRQLVNNSVQYGGCLTINWHDRSLAPERFWDAPYRELLEDMRNRGAWFATAGQTVSWFRMRRSSTFEVGMDGHQSVHVNLPAQFENLPSLRLRTYQQQAEVAECPQTRARYLDIPIRESREVALCPGIRV